MIDSAACPDPDGSIASGEQGIHDLLGAVGALPEFPSIRETSIHVQAVRRADPQFALRTEANERYNFHACRHRLHRGPPAGAAHLHTAGTTHRQDISLFVDVRRRYRDMTRLLILDERLI